MSESQDNEAPTPVQTLFTACHDGNVDTVRTLLATEQVHVTDAEDIKDGATPPIQASNLGKLPVVQLLLDHGANMSAIDANGGTALHYAALYG